MAPFGYLTKYTYDAEGRRLTLEQETGDAANPWQVVSWTYTPTGKRASITDPAGDTTSFTYDARDRLWKTTDPTLAVTERQYDAAGQLTQVIDPLGHAIETFTYTANGVVASVTDGEANTTDYVYDGHDRRVQTVYPDGSTEQAAYDDAGNMAQRITRAGDTLSYAYDALDRRVQKTRPGPEVIDYSYDLTGLRTAVTGPEGTHDFTYDTAGRLVSVTDPQLRSVGYAYDAAGQRTELTYPDGDFVTYAYDALGRPTEARLNGTDLLASYSHDALSRRVGINYGNGASAAATFELDDDLSGLTHTLANETIDLTYSYNARGQRTGETLSSALYLWTPAASSSTGYSVNVLNQYTDVGGVAFGYDANGNLTNDGVLSLAYDTENRLTSVSATGLSASYGYDSLDRRSSATVDGSTTEYLYSGSHVLVEYDGSGAEQRRFVYAPGVDEPIAMITASGARYYYHQDALGSVIALSDTAGNVAERYAYGPFGETETVSSLGNPYRYTGRRFDEAAALYHYRARAYSPELGRFLQPDPIGYGDGMNLYTYVANDPINAVDPTGLARVEARYRGIGATFGLATHGYIIVTETEGRNAGREWVYRAGPSRSNAAGIASGVASATDAAVSAAAGYPDAAAETFESAVDSVNNGDWGIVEAVSAVYKDGAPDWIDGRAPTSRETLVDDNRPAAYYRTRLEEFNSMVNAAGIEYRATGPNSNSYTSSAGEYATGRRPDYWRAPGGSIDLSEGLYSPGGRAK